MVQLDHFQRCAYNETMSREWLRLPTSSCCFVHPMDADEESLVLRHCILFVDRVDSDECHVVYYVVA